MMPLTAKHLHETCQISPHFLSETPVFNSFIIKKKKKNIEQDIIWSTLFKDTECTLIHTNKHQFTTNESLQF